MSTSPTSSWLVRPTSDEKISQGTLGYINARNRQRAYDIVIGEFEKSGLTQAALANRVGKSAEVVCRLLSRPQNWESDTFSSLLFAISGGIPRYAVDYPLGKPDFIDQTIFEPRGASSTSKIVSIRDSKIVSTGDFLEFNTDTMVA